MHERKNDRLNPDKFPEGFPPQFPDGRVGVRNAEPKSEGTKHFKQSSTSETPQPPKSSTSSNSSRLGRRLTFYDCKNILDNLLKSQVESLFFIEKKIVVLIQFDDDYINLILNQSFF